MQEIRIEEVTSWIKEINNISLQRAYYPNFLKPFHLVTLGLTAKQNQWSNLTL